MRRKRFCFAFLFVLIPACLFADEPASETASPEQIKAWRAKGPAAVDRLISERDRLLKNGHGVECRTLNQTIDEVGGAYYSHVSGLYWYTDEAEAMRVAKEQGKPVLALRLLGNLDEELSCANSRFFRTLLYANEDVSKLLHDKYILTWTSVRPVPKITVDLRNGLKVERTITGNSVHYVLLPDGKIVDVFPGLYGPNAFRKRLAGADVAAVAAMKSKQSEEILRGYRDVQLGMARADWKSATEAYRTLSSLLEKQRKAEVLEIGSEPSSPPDFWRTIGNVSFADTGIDERSLTLLQQEASRVMAALQAVQKPEKESPEDGLGGDRGSSFAVGINQQGFTPNLDFQFRKNTVGSVLVHCLVPDVAADTARNEYCGRVLILKILNGERMDPDEIQGKRMAGTPSDEVAPTLAELNEWVYQKLFRCPIHDPWMGLAELENSSGLGDAGLIYPREAEEGTEVGATNR